MKVNPVLLLLLLFWQLGNAQNIIVDDQRTAQNLVEDVLLNNTGCASVSNFQVSGGNFNTGENSYGYFNSNGSVFPFQEGLILSTGKINDTPGPNDDIISGDTSGWTGFDSTIASILNENNTFNATSLEFDFVPLVDYMSFEFLFTSEEYTNQFMCLYSDVFGFLIKEASAPDSDYVNIALVPGTNTPIKVTTVHPAGNCPAINEQYFGGFNGFNYPTDFNGQTVPLIAESAVTPGVTYRIKLIIADDGDQIYDSAVFLRAGSFNIGTFLGEDRILANDNVLCGNEELELDAGGQGSAVSYQWYKDGAMLMGETNQIYNVTPLSGDGIYAVEVDLGGGCISEGEIEIEYGTLPVVADAQFSACRIGSTDTAEYNLYNVDLVNDITINDSALTVENYYLDLDDAENNPDTMFIPNPSNFINTQLGQLVIARIVNASGCASYAEVTLGITENPDIQANETRTYCLDTFPSTIRLHSGFVNGVESDYAYSWSNGSATEFTDINQLGDYTITITDANGCSNSRTITVIQSEVFILDEPAFIDESVVYCNNTFPTMIDLLSNIENNDTSNYTFSWSNGEMTENIAVNTAGMYTLTVTNQDGCFVERTITVTDHDFFEFPEPSFTNIENLLYCQDNYPDTISLAITFDNNDINDYTFLWSTGATSSSIAINLAGDYSVEIRNPQGCLEIKTFYVSGSSVFNSTEPNFQDETVYYCTDTFPNTIPLEVGIENNNLSNFTYLWSTGATSSSIDINEVGNYTVSVFNSDGCSVERTITVLPSEMATYQNALITDTIHDGLMSVEVQVTGQGDYIYALDLEFGQIHDETFYQEESNFDSVPIGTHILYVMDRNGCAVLIKEILILDYPKFITPNNDGFYDTWNLDNINAVANNFSTFSKIVIFDRYGKVMAMIDPQGDGWDGNFMGEPAPASDYWFTVELIDHEGRKRVKKGHFTLRRK